MKHYVLMSVCFLIAFSCKKDPAGPPPNGGADTTSHNFTFVLDTLGDGTSSVLSDVFIISENNVIAVGEIYLRDSLGGFGEPPYGVARWDGTRWNLFRLSALGPTGVVSNLRPRGVFAFSATDVWFASGGVFRWNGQSVTPYWINHFPGNPNPILEPGQTAEKLWGTSSSNLYAAGRQGAIAHFNGSTWQRLTTGTTVDIQDIYGAVDARTGERLILAAASYVTQLGPMRMLRISEMNVVDTIVWSTGRRVHSVWFQDREMLFAAGGGVFTRRNQHAWEEVTQLPLIFTRRIRGNVQNDVTVVGDFGYVAHYNGNSWKNYTGNEVPVLQNGVWSSVVVKQSFVVAVGEFDDRALVLRGMRQ